MSHQNAPLAAPEAVNAPTKTYQDSLVFEDSVVEKIAGLVSRDVQGILGMKGSFISDITENIKGNDITRGIRVNIEDKNVVMDIKLILEFGASAPLIFNELKEKIGANLTHMTGLTLRELNVNVVDVMTRREYEQANRSE